MGKLGVKVNRAEGGLGRRNASPDGDCLLVIKSAVATEFLALATVAKVFSIQAVEALGITPSYDDTNSILAHYHASEFFRINPDGDLHLLLDDGSLTDADFKTAIKSNDSIRAVGVVRNAAAPETIDAEAIQWQGIVDALEEEVLRIDSVFLEGVITDPETGIGAYPDLRELNARSITVIIGADPVVRGIKSEYESHAAIGTALGAFSIRGVNENLGSINVNNKPASHRGLRDYPLTGRNRFLNAVLQNGVAFSALSRNAIEELDTKGYVAIGNYSGYGGFFFTDSHTCIETASDYSRIENNRVWNKGARVLRDALLPKVKSNLLKDPSTGYIAEIAAKELEGIGLAALEGMEAAGEISGKDVHVPTDQVLNNDEALQIKAQLVFNTIIHEIEIDLGLTNKIT